MSIGKLESFLGRHIEGFFNKKFSSDLEFTEVIKKLEREVMHKKKKTYNGYIVPNNYFIDMAAEDYQRMCMPKFQNRLKIAVEKAVIANDCFMDGKLSITLDGKDDLKVGVCNIWSCYNHSLDAKEKEQSDETRVNKIADVAAAEDSSSHTIILDKSDFMATTTLPEEHKMTSLLAVGGPDQNSYLEFGEKQIYIGRRIKNDFILTDTNASRVHAYISYKRHRHVLYDADSLNGTFVGKKLVNGACVLNAGDKIQIGSTVLVYDIIKG